MAARVKLEEMTWPEVEAARREGVETVIIPAASVEQHGPHLPLLTDTLIGDRVAEMTARKLGKTLVAPVIRPGLSSHHMGFPGSFTLSPETFRRVLEEYCLSLLTHGFRTFILTSGHGGNFTYLDAVGPYLQDALRAREPRVRVIPHVNLVRYMRTQQDFVRQRFGIPVEEAGWHADVMETACILAIRPDLVNMGQAAAGWIGDSTTILDRLFVDGFRAVSPNGILGDARKATREMGEALLEHLTDVLAEELRGRLGWTSA